MTSCKQIQLKFMNGPMEGYTYTIEDQVIIQKSDNNKSSKTINIPFDKFLDKNHVKIYKRENWYILNQVDFKQICFTQDPDNIDKHIEIKPGQKQLIYCNQYILIGNSLIKILKNDLKEKKPATYDNLYYKCNSLYEIYDKFFLKKSNHATRTTQLSRSLHEIFDNIFSESSRAYDLGYCNAYSLIENVLQKYFKSRFKNNNDLFLKHFYSLTPFDKLIPWLKETHFQYNYTINPFRNDEFIVSPSFVSIFNNSAAIHQKDRSNVVDIYELLRGVILEKHNLVGELIEKTNFKDQINLYKSHESVHFWKEHFIDIETFLFEYIDKNNKKLFEKLNRKKINDIINVKELLNHLGQLRSFIGAAIHVCFNNNETKESLMNIIHEYHEKNN